jgi:hypothetical protein
MIMIPVPLSHAINIRLRTVSSIRFIDRPSGILLFRLRRVVRERLGNVFGGCEFDG